MQVYQFLVAYVGLGTLLPVFVHFKLHGVISVSQIALAFFLVLNILISFWEIGLGLHIRHIQKEYKRLQDKFKKDNFASVVEFFFLPVSVSNMVSLKFWSRVWSTYSLYDPSYANCESYGFFIDVGNGWSTLLPSALFLVGMSVDLMAPRWLGILGILKFYQEFYGTIMYFTSYVFNARYRGKTALEVSLFVGLSNGLWFFFPLLGMYISGVLIFDSSYDVLRM